MNFFGPVCQGAQPNFLGLFDLSIAPPLLYYSYIPIVIASLLIALYVFFKDKKSLKSKLLLLITTFFALWVINILVQWVGVYDTTIMLGWQLTAIFEVGMFLSTLYFAQVFLYNRDISFTEKIAMVIIALATFIAVPTTSNVAIYDVQNCQGVNGVLWNIIYALEPAIIVLMIWSGFNAYRQEANLTVRKQIVIFTTGVAIFLTAFFYFNLYGELIQEYAFNLWGPIGMVVFLILLGYMIVQYQVFNVKLFATQILVIAIGLLIGSQLFTPNSILDLYVIAATFVGFSISGIFLIRSVKKEIQQREELAIANKGQENLIHVMNHQIKGYLGTARNIFAELSQGDDYGQMPEASKPLLNKGLEEMAAGVDYVQQILKGASAHSGTLPYDMRSIDLKSLVANLASKEKEVAEKAGLSFESNIVEGDYATTGDATMLEEAFKNIITNAIKYNNPNGSVSITLSRADEKILFAVKDTGVGISKEDAPKLFKPGGMGKDSIKHNVESSGYGLALVKPVVEKHQGRVWYVSNSPEQGTTFFIELPVVQSGSPTP